MDFRQLLSSGFQFLNLDDACEAEVDILQDMLFKKQDVDQLSKLFHLKSYPDGDSAYHKYYPLDQDQSPAEHGGLVGEGSSSEDCVNSERHQQGVAAEAAASTDPSVVVPNGPHMAMSQQQQQQQQQQHHIINMDSNTGECPPSGEMNPPMMPQLPPPLRSYFSQQHVPVPVVHGSPQGQVGSPGIGQPHGQVGIVSPAYPHVSVPISMHQQQLIMMQAQPQPYAGLQPVHYVPSQRHHGHPPPHGYVQGEHPLSPESVQYHHNPNLMKVSHDPSSHNLPHTHPSNASTQGGPNKYNSGPRNKNHSRSIDRNRRNDPEMMNSYPAYYPGIPYPNVAYYNQQLAHTVTGSPIIMPASHHNKAPVPVTMYNPYVPSHQYSSPPPNVQAAITPNASPPESQQQQQQQHQQPPPPPPPTIPVSEAHHVAGSQQQQQHISSHPAPTPNVAPPAPTQPDSAPESGSPRVVVPPQIPTEKKPDLPSQVAVDNQSAVDSKQKESRSQAEILNNAGARSSSPAKSLKQKVQPQPEQVVPSSTQPAEAIKPSPPSTNQESIINNQQVNTASPVPDQHVQKTSTKCSSPAPLDDNTRVQPNNLPPHPPPATGSAVAPVVNSVVATVASPPVQPKVQTWAETSAPKPQRSSTSTSNNFNVNSGSSSAASAASAATDEKTLKDKQQQQQGHTKSAEFPALAKMNINGNTNTSSVTTNSNVSSSASSSTSTTTTTASGGASAPPKGRSWASICRNPNAPLSGPATTANGSGVGASSSGGNSVQPSSAAPQGVAQEIDSSVSSTTVSGAPNSSGAGPNSSDPSNKSNVSQNIVSSSSSSSVAAAPSDNNGHMHVPMQSQQQQSHNVNNDSSINKSKSSLNNSEPVFDPSCLNNENDSLAIRLGEFLAHYALDHHATALTPRGLTNQSNFCYINATLQALMACPPFVNLFRSMRDVGLAKTPCKATPIIQSVFDFVSEFEPLNRGNTNKRDRRSDTFITGANLEPSGIRKVLGLLDGSTFKVEGRQQDAEEFLSHLLNGLHDEMIKVIKWYENRESGGSVSNSSPQQQASAPPAAAVSTTSALAVATAAGVLNGQHPEASVSEEDDDADHWQVMGPKNKGCLTRKTNVMKSPISEMLFGQLCSALHRTNSFKSATLQPFFTLQLDIQSDSIRSVRDALEGLSFKEEVSGLVSNSGQETEAWRQLSLEELPMILILHLKRFVYDKSGHKIQKLDKKLEFGIDLEIAKELLSVNTRGKCTLKQRQYKLFAVVYHDGEEAYKGHYIADCFHPSGGNLWGQVGWLRYDDIQVKPIAENNMLNSQPPRVPYLLYYRRADTLLSHHVQIPRNKDRPNRNFGSVDS